MLRGLGLASWTGGGDAPIKVQQFSGGREIGVNVKNLGNPSCTNEERIGFELGGCHPFQIR